MVLGARVGIIEHIYGRRRRAARSPALTVLRDVPRGARWAGLSNAKPIKQYFRELVMISGSRAAPISPACAATG